MIETRPYAAEDQEDFLTLYRACLRHYDIPPATAEQEERILALLASGRHMSCLLAHDGARPVGFATWALTFPAGAGVALYMKEIFVTGAARGTGAGRALLAGLLDIAQAEGCVRFDWQTDGDNKNGQAFYTAINAPEKAKKTYRIMAAEFQDFIDRLT
ncbi:GNAT family N-acetyltransferase [Roseovarius sp. CAU 1744]|uniref:GNAT family N-acetyltransferase n=1 Tax=Roseovarius sp. CAU 1744 TaxID=3140368 RepID=UPI00325C200B